MESEKNQVETQDPEPESAPGSPSSCQRLKFDESAGFVANMRNGFSEFIHAPMDEHRACFKETFQKVIDSLDDWNCNDKFERFFHFSEEGLDVALTKLIDKKIEKFLALLYYFGCES